VRVTIPLTQTEISPDANAGSCAEPQSLQRGPPARGTP